MMESPWRDMWTATRDAASYVVHGHLDLARSFATSLMVGRQMLDGCGVQRHFRIVLPLRRPRWAR